MKGISGLNGTHYWRVVLGRTRVTPARRPGAGFTLIELMVVLVIMAMLSTLIVPSIQSALRKGGLSATGNKLCELLNFSYMTAVTRHRSVVLNLDPARRRCWVSVCTASLPWLDEQQEPEPRVLEAMELPEGTEFTVVRGEGSAFTATSAQSWETITFRSDGTTEDARIELTNHQGEHFQIEIFGLSGEVRATEGPL